jgi:hypothetical protein
MPSMRPDGTYDVAFKRAMIKETEVRGIERVAADRKLPKATLYRWREEFGHKEPPSVKAVRDAAMPTGGEAAPKRRGLRRQGRSKELLLSKLLADTARAIADDPSSARSLVQLARPLLERMFVEVTGE